MRWKPDHAVNLSTHHEPKSCVPQVGHASPTGGTRTTSIPPTVPPVGLTKSHFVKEKSHRRDTYRYLPDQLPADLDGEVSQETQVQETGASQNSLGDTVAAPAGRQMFDLQRWGASQEHGRDLVARLVAVAGPRLPHLDQLFERMRLRVRWDGKRRIAWIAEQAERMASDPVYWPIAKKQSAATGVDAIMAALQGGPRTKAQLVKALAKSEPAIASLTQSLCDAGWIVRVRPGVYALPAVGAAAHVPASEAVLSALAAAGKPMTTAELCAATGKQRNAVDTALVRLKKLGTIVSVGRGLVALAGRPACSA